MRQKLMLAAAGLAVAAALAPVQPANAVCVTAYQTVTGQCSPCTTAGAVLRRVGLEDVAQCLA